jgi:cytochrome c biogenesis protein CcmG/thiol:disulfide interchange protein DsbE
LADRKSVLVGGYICDYQREDALRWLDHFGHPYWLVVADTQSKSAIDWGIYGAPETFLVDANGTIRWKHVGPLTDAIIDKELMPALQRIEGAR